ncbi:acyltransferase family protein [Tepidimonas aquatica]|uniref:Acyltransferase family protein n=1 Tax=Tepidimonas aquatica TaxID=247482 RepID=A0A554WJU0_9BURK|nr:acyltransferase family protein [Tepidimonas aquatica]TSE23830.1 Acyltransferase family protein [Tepidimonas aquatica]
MFGSLRLLLALLVALSHVGVSVRGYHLGVPAVVVFLLLSGYVVAAMLHGAPAWRAFWAERALRLLPPYYTAAALGVGVWLLSGAAIPFFSGAGQPALWLAALAIIPLNYATLWPVLDTFTPVPPAWSLGLEIQFYLLAPWLLAAPRRAALAWAASAAVGAAAQLGLLPSDAFGYRLLVGNLYIFLSGAALYWVQHGPAANAARWRAALYLTWAGVAVVAAATAALGRWGTPFVAEVAVGYLLGLPLVAALARLSRRRWDDALAHLAYPLFLVHFAALWALQGAGRQPSPQAPLALAAYLCLALALAAAVHLVAQRPWLHWRRRLRAAAQAAPSCGA